jgi:ankyrin repeat protein
MYNGDSLFKYILGSALLFNNNSELLLNNKADPNICSEGGSPLYTASLDVHTEIVELKLNNKADPNICFKGVSPLEKRCIMEILL